MAKHPTTAPKREAQTAKPPKTQAEAQRVSPTAKPIEGETITQRKANVDDVLAGNRSMDNIGTGSIIEEAPAVRGQTEAADSDRVVQQGDEVLLISKNPVNGVLENLGRVIKVNPDSSLAIRVPLSNGETQDFTGVGNEPTQDANPHWVWPSGK